MKTAVIVLLALCAAVSEATQVRSCSNERALPDTEVIQISGCNTPPCKLKKKTKINVEFKFNPLSDVKALDNSVSAEVFGVPLPFVGVDGTNACSNIFDQSGQPGCPLKSSNTYTYKNSFDVLEIYPKIKTTVRWALADSTGKDHICFKVDSRIV